MNEKWMRKFSKINTFSAFAFSMSFFFFNFVFVAFNLDKLKVYYKENKMKTNQIKTTHTHTLAHLDMGQIQIRPIYGYLTKVYQYP